MKFKVKVYDGVKYLSNSKVTAEVTYEHVKKAEITWISDDDIYNEGFDCVDPYGEYLILTFASGERSTFCFSFCDIINFYDYRKEVSLI